MASTRPFVMVRLYDRAQDLADRAARERISVASLVEALVDAGWDLIPEESPVPRSEPTEAPRPRARVYSPVRRSW